MAAMGSSYYDDDGVATSDRDFVRNGVVTSYVLSHYSANRLGLETTGNAGGVHNLMVDMPTCTKEELLAQMGSGLLVTELMGQGVNLVTGNYSRGASGFWVENGRISYPVEGITIANHLSKMFKGILAMADDVDCRGNYRVGSLLIDEMAVGGTSH